MNWFIADKNVGWTNATAEASAPDSDFDDMRPKESYPLHYRTGQVVMNSTPMTLSISSSAINEDPVR